jgi:hypothetical protein
MSKKSGNVPSDKSKEIYEFKNEPQQHHPNSLSGMMSKAASKKEVKAAYGNNRGHVPSVEDVYHDGAHAACDPAYEDSDLMLDEGSPSIPGNVTMTGPSGMPGGGLFTKSPSKPLAKDRPVMADTLSPLPALPEDIDLLRGEAHFERVSEKIHVNLVAIDKKSDKNKAESIKANGDPLGGYAYVSESDQFLISCCDHLALGIIPMAFRVSFPGYAGKQLIPLPDSLIYKHASPQQRKMIKIFREKNPDCDIQYVQSLSRS